MVEIPVITPSYPIQPANKIIRDKRNKQNPNNDQLNHQDQHENDRDNTSTENALPHIDEIV